MCEYRDEDFYLQYFNSGAHMLNKSIAILIPCHNEALTISDVILRFQTILPDAIIYVYDNNSNDQTVAIAKQHPGIIVRNEKYQGKGSVVRRMFADIEADIYILVDGDNTYEAESTPQLINLLINEHLDMVVGARVEKESDDKYGTYRFGHRFGNALFSKLIARLFGKKFSDVFSGFRVFSRRFVKSFPANSRGFEIETELTIHSLELRLPTAEVNTVYGARPEGSTSKLNSYRDGLKILLRILILLKEVRPLLFFSFIFLGLTTFSLILFLPVFISYLQTGLVQRFPTAILSTGIVLLGFMSLICGFILDSVTRGKKEIKRFVYLSIK